MRLLLMGTGPFATPCFDEVFRQGRDEVALVIAKPETAGPGSLTPPPSPVAAWADRCGLPLEKPDDVNDPATIDRLRALQVDLFLVCDYGKILSRDALTASRLGGINLHGSLLPRHRGAAPVHWAVWKGDRESGVSVILMTPKLDAGPILTTRRTPIGLRETAAELETRLAELGREAVPEALDMLRQWDGQGTLGVPQDPALATTAPRLRKSDGRLDWSRSSEELLRQFRGLQPWPGVFTFAPKRKGEVRLLVQQLAPSDVDRAPAAEAGEVVEVDEAIHVATGDGVLQITQVQPAGKKSMSAAELVRGRTVELGQRLR